MIPLPRSKKEVRDFRSEIISAPEAALLLGLPERTFYRLVEEGVVPKVSEGKYVLGEIVEAFWRSKFDFEGLEAARTRLTTAQAELAELDLAEQRGEMHRATAVMRVWADNVMNAKTRLLAIPTKIAPELVGKSVHEIQAALKKEIYEALYELAGYDEQRIARATASRR